MTESIAGIAIPDSALAKDATEIIRDTTNELIYHHSRRVYLFGSMQSRRLGITPDPELLYIAAMFHDTGLVDPYRTAAQRFEMDGADAARDFLTRHHIDGDHCDIVWAAIALHTTPEVPYKMHPVIAATTAGVETDVLGLNLDAVTEDARAAVVDAHPRPNFKRAILQAFTDGFDYRPDSTFGTVNADVLRHFQPGFHALDFVEIVENSPWPQ
ncbi:HD domain-containing protein [Mycolicibacterium cosmeticum]|uniref:HD domain-containing protein n=1 Tax=Mycolicibacterium cosmeticum TaxID=258533 RepID=UPI0032046B9A